MLESGATSTLAWHAWCAWVAYAESNGFDPALLEVVVLLRKLVIYYAVHLRETRFPRPGVPI